MSKKIVVVNQAFTESMRKKIEETAKKYAYEVHFYDNNEDAMSDVEDAEIAFGRNADLLRAGKQLRWFCTQSAGVDSFLKPGVIQNEDMILTNSSGAYGMTLAEHTIMLTLAVLRNLPYYDSLAAKHEWAPKLIPMKGIVGSRVTILGTGDLGTEIAKHVQAFSPASVTGVNRSGKERPYFDRIVTQDQTNSVLPETDILIMALPGTAETKYFISDEWISLLPKEAIIVNVGRGNALDPKALEKALKDGVIAGAALDVFEKEPLAEDNPLWSCPNLLITPHVAGNMTLAYTVEKTCDQFVEELIQYCEGTPMAHVVSRKKGY